MLYIFNRLKKILPIFIILILTGCTATYNIDIDNNISVKETLDIIEEETTKFDKQNENLYNVTPRQYLETNLKWPTPVYNDEETNPYEPIKINNVKYYTKIDISNYDKLGIRYSYNFNQNQFNKSNIVNTCYEYKFSKIDYLITFETQSEFKCFDKYKALDKVNINLNTTCKVKSNNADNIEETTYTWYITKDNYKSKKITFEIDCYKKTKQKNKFNIIVLIILIYLLLIAIIYLLAILKKNKNNKI